MEDTITAISTALGVGGISIIRVSGNESINIVNSIFKGTNLTKVNSHTIHYGFIVESSEIIDEVLVSVMKSPKTFTTEDVVEINCHGGIATTNKVLELLLTKGCRLAEPGEFTKRAFLNGRIDLVKANSVIDLINSKTELSRKMAINGLTGNVSNMIKEIREVLVKILSNIEVNIDYPEYEDIEEMTIDKIKIEIPKIRKTLEKILEESKNGKIIKEGINTVIVGKPNVGKSSLLNVLISEDKAIVTDIAGTTRDIVEGEVNIGGVILKIKDTAGIRETSDIVEKIGVDRSLNLIEDSDLILFILNNNEKITNEEKELLKKLQNKPHIIVINKVDLDNNLKIEDENIVKISAKDNINIDELKLKIKKLFNLEKIQSGDLNYLTSARSVAIIKKCVEKIRTLEKSIDNLLIDMVEIDIKEIWNLLGEIIGETYQDELIDNLFKNFCLGK